MVSHIISSKGRLLHLATPQVMGILNATPDSFYNKGQDSTLDGLLKNAELMLNSGAAILDVGGASSRPGQKLIDPSDELARVLPALEAISQRFPEAWLSIDTYNSAVAIAAIEAGANMVNDISAGRFDKEMMPTVARLQVPYIAMHIQGTPETMQLNPSYGDVAYEVVNDLRERCDSADSFGIKDIIVDPGFGFGKTLEHNYQLFAQLADLRILGRPILVGLSRKSMVCKVLGVTPKDALNGTSALHMVALQRGANILRVHDVKEAIEVIKLFEWTARY